MSYACPTHCCPIHGCKYNLDSDEYRQILLDDVREQKEAAITEGKFDKASELRSRERKILEDRCEVADGTVVPKYPSNNGCELCEDRRARIEPVLAVIDTMMDELSDAKSDASGKGFGPAFKASFNHGLRVPILQEVRDRIEKEVLNAS